VRYLKGQRQAAHYRVVQSRMANAMLQAIGAHATHPDRQVISMSGDAISA
jgi:thiamine pyrophosphate-dependent acetolactate synthase large subunit-like protein